MKNRTTPSAVLHRARGPIATNAELVAFVVWMTALALSVLA